MNIVFAVDIGNTNTKIAVLHDQIVSINNTNLIVLCSKYIASNSELINLFNLLRTIQFAGQQVMFSVSSVVNDRVCQQVLAGLCAAVVNILKLDQRAKIKIKIWNSAEILQAAQINNAAELAHLGCDRALKIFYLNQLNGTATKLSFGCGTAFTLEAVQGNQLIDSMILPGLELQLQALYTNTAKLPELKITEIESVLSSSPQFSTLSSIVRGVLSSYTGLILQVMHKFPDADIFISGGYAKLLINYLGSLAERFNLVTNIESSVLLSKIFIAKLVNENY